MRRCASSILSVVCAALGVSACSGGTGGPGSNAPDTVTFPDERPESAGDGPASTEREPPPATPEVQRAEELLAAGNAGDARPILESAVEETPGDARAWFDLGLASEMESDAEGAERAYRAAVRQAPEFVEALNNLGLLLRNLERFEDAIPVLRRAVQLVPDDAGALANLAFTLEDAGDAEGAKPVYREALRAAPRDPRVRANFGLLLLSMGEREDAAEELSRALTLTENDDPASLLTIGNGLRRAGRFDVAVRAMERAVTASGGDVTPALLSEFALAQRAHGDRPAAEATLERALSIDPRYATAHYLLANMQAARSAYREAIQHYRRYLALEPDGPLAGQARQRLRAAQRVR